MITKKEEIMKDLKFCQELMNRLVKFADEYYIRENSIWQCNHTVVQNDIIRLRRELNEIRKKIEE